MAAKHTEPIEPMDLANMRENGVRSLWVQCNQCRHTTVMNVDHLPGDVTVPSFGPQMVCTDVRPIALRAYGSGSSQVPYVAYLPQLRFFVCDHIGSHD